MIYIYIYIYMIYTFMDISIHGMTIVWQVIHGHLRVQDKYIIIINIIVIIVIITIYANKSEFIGDK